MLQHPQDLLRTHRTQTLTADGPKTARAWEESRRGVVHGGRRCQTAARIEVNGLPREQSLYWPRRSDGNPITLIRTARHGAFSRRFLSIHPSVKRSSHGSLVELTSRVCDGRRPNDGQGPLLRNEPSASAVRVPRVPYGLRAFT